MMGVPPNQNDIISPKKKSCQYIIQPINASKFDTRRNFYAIPDTVSKVDRTEHSIGYPPEYQVKAQEAYTI
jgi:hypothetical protein